MPDDERTVDEIGQRTGVAADRDHGGEFHRSREHRQPVEERPLLLVEEPVGPRHDVPQGAVPGRGGPASAAEHPERLLRRLQGVEQAGQAQRERAGGGQLEGERQAVEPPAHLGDQLVVGVGCGGGVAGPHPVDEQPGRRVRLQRRDRQHLLAVDPHRFAAGEQQVDARGVGRDRLHQRGDLVADVLAVVQHHQLVADREHLDDAVDHGSAPLGAAVGEP